MPRFDRQPKSLSPAQRKRRRRDYLRRLQAEHGANWPKVAALPIYWFHGALVDANGHILKGQLNSGAPRPLVLPQKRVLTRFERAPLRLVPHPKPVAGNMGPVRHRHLPWGSEAPPPDYRDWSEP